MAGVRRGIWGEGNPGASRAWGGVRVSKGNRRYGGSGPICHLGQEFCPYGQETLGRHYPQLSTPGAGTNPILTPQGGPDRCQLDEGTCGLQDLSLAIGPPLLQGAEQGSQSPVVQCDHWLGPAPKAPSLANPLPTTLPSVSYVSGMVPACNVPMTLL